MEGSVPVQDLADHGSVSGCMVERCATQAMVLLRSSPQACAHRCLLARFQRACWAFELPHPLSNKGTPVTNM
jgi:hypothetical protein